MVSTVTARPNHYETLGVKPTATGEEIEQAFARHLFRPRAFGGLTQISIAYETLRDPAKRRAYDDSIGVRPQPLPPTARPHEVQFSGSAQFLLSSFMASGGPRVDDPSPPPEPPAEPRTAEFIAAPLHEPEPQAEFEPEPQIAEYERLRDPEDGPVRWKRAAIILGVPVLAVALAGAWAGSLVGNNAAEAEAPEQAVTVALPKAKPQSAIDEAADPGWSVVETKSDRRRRAATAARRAERAPASQPGALSAKQLEELQPLTLRTGEVAGAGGGLAGAETPVVQPAAASLSLSSAAVARTLHRVGYSCGQVASTAAVEGDAPGVFKVTCTSGQSYRAAPVRGRYYFRRWRG